MANVQPSGESRQEYSRNGVAWITFAAAALTAMIQRVTAETSRAIARPTEGDTPEQIEWIARRAADYANAMLRSQGQAENPAARKVGNVCDTAAAAAYLGAAEGTLRNWRSRGRGPAYHRCGKRIVYRQADLDQYLANSRIETAES